MADITFTTDECNPQATATADSIVYTTGLDINSKVVLASSGMKLDSAGTITADAGIITLTSLIEKMLASPVQSKTSATSLTVDLSLGSTIVLQHNANCNITFTGLPAANNYRFILIARVQDATTTNHTLTFGGTHLKEAGSALVFTYTANAVDLILGFVDSSGNFFTRTTLTNYQTVIPLTAAITGSFGNTFIHNVEEPRTTTGVEAGMMITTNLDGTLNATALKTDGIHTFINDMIVSGCTAPDMQFSSISVTSTGGILDVDFTAHNFIILTQDSDITTINITPNDSARLAYCIIFRYKDATSTPREITFSNTQFKWDVDPVLTQDPSAVDIIVIQSAAGFNLLSISNDYKV